MEPEETGVLLAGSFLLLAVLEPAMWHHCY
ncbi:hypothetical protein HaLaN_04043, partial [Haematococcus lacustris]